MLRSAALIMVISKMSGSTVIRIGTSIHYNCATIIPEILGPKKYIIAFESEFNGAIPLSINREKFWKFKDNTSKSAYKVFKCMNSNLWFHLGFTINIPLNSSLERITLALSDVNLAYAERQQIKSLLQRKP